MKTSLRAILFDFDGVLANTEPVHLEMFQKVLQAEGIELTHDDYYQKYLGFDDRDCFSHIYRDHGKKLDDAKRLDLIRTKNRFFLEAVHGRDLMLKGAKELVLDAASKYFLAIASGALRSDIQAVLSTVALDEKFPVIVAAEDVEQGKPSPEGFLMAIRHLNRDIVPTSEILVAEECLVIEDSPWGVEAAHAAGTKCVGILTSYPREKMQKADLVVPSLEQIQWEQIEKLF